MACNRVRYQYWSSVETSIHIIIFKSGVNAHIIRFSVITFGVIGINLRPDRFSIYYNVSLEV